MATRGRPKKQPPPKVGLIGLIPWLTDEDLETLGEVLNTSNFDSEGWLSTVNEELRSRDSSRS